MSTTAPRPVPPKPSTRHDGLDADIASLDLAPVSFLAADEYFWTLEEVDRTERDYRRFLQSVRDRPGEAMVPTLTVDRYWHCHILCLELYLEHCQRLFGQTLLHFPFSGRLPPTTQADGVPRFTEFRPLRPDS